MIRKQLTEICRPKQWKTIPGKDLKEQGFPVYGANGIIGYWDEYNHEKETLTIACRGTCGTVNIAEPKSYINGNAMCLDELSDEVELKYLYCFLKGYDFTEIISGTTIPQITIEGLKKVAVAIPSKERQLELIAIFDKVSEVILNRQLELQKLDELVKARFVEMFENGKYQIHTVEELCSDVVDCPHTTPKYEGELKNPAIRTSEIKKGFLTWDTMKYVSDDEYEERIARLRPERGDIVYGREGTFGNAAILPTGYKFCLGQRVMLLRPNYSICTSEYLLHALISDSVYQQALEKNNASTVAHVNVKDVKQFRIPLPPIELQNQFAEFAKQLDKSKVINAKYLINSTYRLITGRFHHDYN